MTKISRRMDIMIKRIDKSKRYDINTAITLLKELTVVKFIESVDVAIQLGIDARKSDQNIRGTVMLPHGIGRYISVAVFTHGSNAEDARIAGADVVGMEDLAEQIKNNKIKYDVILASSDAMNIVSNLGHILGPRGLMPTPKLGTVTSNIAEAVKCIKTGQIRYRNDKHGIIHTSIGKINFKSDQIKENLESLIIALKKNKPIHTKGVYVKEIHISTTMGMGITVDKSSLSTTIN